MKIDTDLIPNIQLIPKSNIVDIKLRDISFALKNYVEGNIELAIVFDVMNRYIGIDKSAQFSKNQLYKRMSNCAILLDKIRSKSDKILEIKQKLIFVTKKILDIIKKEYASKNTVVLSEQFTASLVELQIKSFKKLKKKNLRVDPYKKKFEKYMTRAKIELAGQTDLESIESFSVNPEGSDFEIEYDKFYENVFWNLWFFHKHLAYFFANFPIFFQ